MYNVQQKVSELTHHIMLAKQWKLKRELSYFRTVMCPESGDAQCWQSFSDQLCFVEAVNEVIVRLWTSGLIFLPQFINNTFLAQWYLHVDEYVSICNFICIIY